jgi:hypothetical protein
MLSLFFFNFCPKHFSFDRDVNVLRSPCKIPVILVRLYWKLNFLDEFWKNFHISNFMKILPVGAELLHAEGWTHRQTDRQTVTNVQTLRSS